LNTRETSEGRVRMLNTKKIDYGFYRNNDSNIKGLVLDRKPDTKTPSEHDTGSGFHHGSTMVAFFRFTGRQWEVGRAMRYFLSFS